MKKYILVLTVLCRLSAFGTQISTANFITVDKSDYFYLYTYSDYLADSDVYNKQPDNRTLIYAYPIDVSEAVKEIRENLNIKSCLSSPTLTLALLDDKLMFHFEGLVDEKCNLRSCGISVFSRNGKEYIKLTEKEAKCIIDYCSNNLKFHNKKTTVGVFLRYVSLDCSVSISE